LTLFFISSWFFIFNWILICTFFIWLHRSSSLVLFFIIFLFPGKSFNQSRRVTVL
jgi:hypothetical protein